MTVQRTEWTCPECSKRYAIPTAAPTPECCPKCQSRSETTGQASSPPHIVRANNSETFSSPEASEEVEFPSIDTSSPEQPKSPARDFRQSKPPSDNKRYPSLRYVAASYRILAGIVAIGSFCGLLYSAKVAFLADPSAERTDQILLGLSIFVGGIIGAFTLLAIGDLIQLVLHIEKNTRGK